MTVRGSLLEWLHVQGGCHWVVTVEVANGCYRVLVVGVKGFAKVLMLVIMMLSRSLLRLFLNCGCSVWVDARVFVGSY